MGGLAVVLLLVSYLAVVVWLVGKVKGTLAKVIVLVLAVLLPTVDAIVGRVYLKHLCDTEGGLRVSRPVVGSEGFQDREGRLDYWIKERGFRFVETGPRPNGMVDRFERRDHEIVLARDVSPISEYRLKLRLNARRGYSVTADEHVVEAIATQEVVGRYTDFSFSGGWVEQLIGSLSDAGPDAAATCALDDPVERRDVRLVTATFRR